MIVVDFVAPKRGLGEQNKQPIICRFFFFR